MIYPDQLAADKLFGTTSRGILRIPCAGAYLGGHVTHIGKWSAPIAVDAIIGWGRRPTTLRARELAARSGLDFIALEDGFLRSFGTGEHFPPLSLVVDDRGIYYDSTQVSALEALLNSRSDVLAGIASEVARARNLILSHRLSKYNHAPLFDTGALREADASRILVIDQTAGDMSVSLGGASADTFTAMLEAARAENPGATIYVKTHPETSSGRKSGYLTEVQEDEHTVVLRDPVNPLSLIEQMDRVYVVTSTMGFEALLAGKPVSVFGLPWYAGWGATDDRQTCPRRTRTRTLEELFAAAYFYYSRYLDPVTHLRGTIFDVIDWLIRQREMAGLTQPETVPDRVIGIGFRHWKAANLKPILSLDRKNVAFVDGLDGLKKQALKPTDKVMHWGREILPETTDWIKACWATRLCMEDGFIRSVGLGSDLIRPHSIVLDKKGIYFDPTRPSDLEDILNYSEFTCDELERARKVRQFIVRHGITKYNHEPRGIPCWNAQGKTIVFVPGQVEDDASIRYGCIDVKTNLDLLAAARLAHPDAYIVYKPHPDVLSGNRLGKVALDQAGTFANHIETTLSVVSCIEACDVVHTMTSLSGFDALLRGKKVVVYGQPFYAGWGLTEDRVVDGVAWPRRTRRLQLDELVAGVLLRYPIYWDWKLKGYTTCEAVLHRIVEERDTLEQAGQLEKLKTGYIRRQFRKLGILARTWGIAA